ncbi:MAG: 3'-5' exonuclease [Armatimonadetes bacterium]|nr:3'-5' exonuclease [Armatimonadota bacterium]
MSRILALDFETSGLDPKRHAPVTLGVALMEGEEVIASQEWLFAPPVYKGKVNREYDIVALGMSGHTWTTIKRDGLAHSVVCLNLAAWALKNECREAMIVAFNAPFDLAFYSELMFLGGSWSQERRCYQTFTPPLLGPWQCARMLAADRLDLPRYSLDAVAEHFGLSRKGDTHGALEDAILAGRVFHRLTEDGAPAMEAV